MTATVPDLLWRPVSVVSEALVDQVQVPVEGKAARMRQVEPPSQKA